MIAVLALAVDAPYLSLPLSIVPSSLILVTALITNELLSIALDPPEIACVDFPSWLICPPITVGCTTINLLDSTRIHEFKFAFLKSILAYICMIRRAKCPNYLSF